MKHDKLTFALNNAKLTKRVAILSLPAGWSCPFAKMCLAKVDRITGKLTGGKHATVRCFATTPELLFKNVRESRWHNWELLQAAGTVQGMADLIVSSLPPSASLCRLDASGDFFNQIYFDAWIEVAKAKPTMIFYAYTKALPFWIKRLGQIPANLHLVASLGGTHDHLIAKHGLRSAKIVFSEGEAKELGLPIDHDDSHGWNYGGDFAILLHGAQPKGSPAAIAWEKIKRHGRGGYKADYFAHYDKAEKARKEAIFSRKFAFLRSGGIVLA